MISDLKRHSADTGMIAIFLVHGAEKCGYFPVHCAVILVDFFGCLCYDLRNKKCLGIIPCLQIKMIEGV